MRPGQQGFDWLLSFTSFTVDCYSLSLSIIHDYLLLLTVINLLLIKTIATGILCHVMGPKRCCRTVAFSPSAQTASVLLLGCGICGIMIMVGLVLENLDINYEYYYVCFIRSLPLQTKKLSICGICGRIVLEKRLNNPVWDRSAILGEAGHLTYGKDWRIIMI